VYAEAFPERKVEVVRGLQESGRVIAFVGDGINDSAALAHASVSVSFAGATDMARETADIVLMDDDLSNLILAIKVCKNAMKTVYQNIGLILGPNLSAMAFAVVVGLNPVAAVVVNNGSAIVAEMNGFRPMMGPPGRKQLMNRKSLMLASAQQDAPRVRALLGVASADAGHSSTQAADANGSTGAHTVQGDNGAISTHAGTPQNGTHAGIPQPAVNGA
jgi:Cu2+-exporting ATPase